MIDTITTIVIGFPLLVIVALVVMLLAIGFIYLMDNTRVIEIVGITVSVAFLIIMCSIISYQAGIFIKQILPRFSP